MVLTFTALIKLLVLLIIISLPELAEAFFHVLVDAYKVTL